MHSHGADRVIDVKFKVQNIYYNDDQQARNDADCCRSERVHRVTAGCYSDKACKRSVETHGYVGLTVFDPCKDHCGACRD